MRCLSAHGFPTPRPIDHNRHVVAMSRVAGCPMSQIKTGRLEGAEGVFLECLSILKRLAAHGLIHCDLNEFNLMLDENLALTLIDFPQMVSVSHPNASDLFDRDLGCLVKFFAMKMRYRPPDHLLPSGLLEVLLQAEAERAEGGGVVQIDQEVRASGWGSGGEGEGISTEEEALLSEYLLHTDRGQGEGEGEEEEEEEEEEGDDDEGEVGGNTLEGVEEEDNIPPSPSPPSVFQKMVATATATATLNKEEEGEEEEEDGEEEAGDEFARERLGQARDRMRRNLQRSGGRGGKGTRNATKKINKYGRIVKHDKIEY
jgi:RIO kinase 2